MHFEDQAISADQQAYLTLAEKVMPGGVSSPVRAFSAVGAEPFFVQSGYGAYVRSMQGDEYIDLVCGWGPLILGHNNADVVSAVTSQAQKLMCPGATTRQEVDLANLICNRLAVGKVRFASTGTEATMTAVRLARGFTGRDIVVKFAGCYHGHSDALLCSAGSGAATFSVAGSLGIPRQVLENTLVLQYNDKQQVERAFAEHGSKIAAVISECVPANMGIVLPQDDFNTFLREITEEFGALFILDEVLTGFRAGPMGAFGVVAAAERQNCASNPAWYPDILTLGKVIGGGLPLAAIAGREDVMNMLAPVGEVYHAGTLNANPLAVVAGLATLQRTTDEVYAHIKSLAVQLTSGLDSIFKKYKIPASIPRFESLFSIFFMRDSHSFTGQDEFGNPAPRNEIEAKTQAADVYAEFFRHMLQNGISLPPSPFETWFVSAAHSDLHIERILNAAESAARALA